jgi:hypothetical protein
MPGTAQRFMYVVGAIEIMAGLVVLVVAPVRQPARRRMTGGHHRESPDRRAQYDIALRDFGLLLGRSR